MDGHWRWGAHLEAAQIEKMLSTAVTPIATSTTRIRENLFVLVGEKLLLSAYRQGFVVPRMCEDELRDFLEQLRDLLLSAIKSSSNDSSPILIDWSDPNRFPEVFLQLGSRSTNEVRVETVSWLVNRLHSVLRCCPQVFEDADSALKNIASAANDDPTGAILRRLVTRHFNQCRAQASKYVRLMTSH